MKDFSCVINGTCGVLDPGLRFGPLFLASPLYGIVFPVLTLITTIANSIIINILLRCFLIHSFIE